MHKSKRKPVEALEATREATSGEKLAPRKFKKQLVRHHYTDYF